jgi:large subunit ribosomal protein L23
MKDIGKIIIKPHVTERTANQRAEDVYCFVVASDANKHDVALAVKRLYKVTPLAVRMVNIAGKKHIQRGIIGRKGGKRKAYVKLKKGDKIEF